MRHSRILSFLFACVGILLLAVLIATLWVYQRTDSDLKSLASLYGFPPAGNEQSAPAPDYVSRYRVGWLKYIAGAYISEKGIIGGPAGEVMNVAVQDGRNEAWRLLDKMNSLPLENRRRVFAIVQDFAKSELTAKESGMRK